MVGELQKNDIQTLVDEIYIERVLRARKTPVAEKFSTGWTLFEEVTHFMRAGVRHHHQNSSSEEIEILLSNQLRRLQQVQEHGIYQIVS